MIQHFIEFKLEQSRTKIANWKQEISWSRNGNSKHCYITCIPSIFMGLTNFFKSIYGFVHTSYRRPIHDLLGANFERFLVTLKIPTMMQSVQKFSRRACRLEIQQSPITKIVSPTIDRKIYITDQNCRSFAHKNFEDVQEFFACHVQKSTPFYKSEIALRVLA